MTDRVEQVTLTAQVNNFLNGMRQAQQETNKTITATQKLAKQGQAYTSLGRSLLLFGGVVAAGVTVAVKAFADFDAKMSQVKTLSGATSEEMLALADAAKTLGQSIGLSAEQVADAEIELVKAGVSVADIMGGALTGALELAAAGQIDVADATEIATVALTQFGLAGKDIPHVADLLTAGADKALGGVQDLGEALKSGGLVASQFGVSLDETVGTLSAFANAGLIGETAGTDLRQLLLKLANPASETADRMKELGLQIYDTSGKFIGLSGLAGQLQDKLGSLTDAQRNQALAMIFGSRAIAGANVLYEEGAAGISKWTSEVNDSGFAAHQAAGKMDNLNGDIQKLGAAFQTDLIDTGSEANNVLRGLVQTFTLLLKAYGDLPAPAKATALAVGAVVAALALTSGIVLTLVPRLGALKTSLNTLQISFKGAAVGAGSLTAALSIAIVAIGLYAEHQAEMSSGAQDFEDTLDQQTGAITDNTRAMVAKKLADKGAFEVAKQLKISQKDLTDAVTEGGPALDKITQKFQDYANFGAIAAGQNPFEATTAKQSLKEINDQVNTGIQDFHDQAAAASHSADSTQGAAKAYSTAAEQASNLNQQISDLTDTINQSNKTGQDAITTNADYQKALADAQATVDKLAKANSKHANLLRENTAAGSANAAMLAELASKGYDAAKAQFDLDQNSDTYIARLKANHDVIVKNAEALGDTKQQAEELADQIAHIPSSKEVQILVDTLNAQKKLTGFFNTYSGTKIYVDVEGAVQRGQGPRKAAGGPIRGAGTGTSDSIPIMASNGEFMSTARTYADPYNAAALEYMNAGGSMRGYTDGWSAGYPSSPPTSAAKAGDNYVEINEVTDPIGTANAVLRRLNLVKA